MTIAEFERRWRGHVPAPLGVRRSYAVLVPLAQRAEGLSMLFEVRADNLERQPGEVCFPGGRMEPGETPVQCALRETWEELGIPPEAVEVIAPLDFQCSLGDQVFYPILGHVAPNGAEALRPSPAEVKEAFWVPVDFFLCHPPEVYTYALVPDVREFPYERIGFPQGYPWRRGRMEVPIYQWEGRVIWGMTARTVRGLLEAMQ